MIEIKNLSRSFGTIKAVDNINFTVNSGSITGFLGPNGAGKTTTMRMMVGYLQPTSGNIEINGLSIWKDPISTSARIGYLPEQNPLYDDMIVNEALRYVADLRSLKKDVFQKRHKFVLAKCGLSEVQNQKIGTLSKGYRQRVGLAQAILHDPDILILDEPTSGLDPNQILEIRDLIRELGQEKTVILSSHIMQEVQALCDRVLIINKGKIIVDDEISHLASYLTDYRLLHLELEGENICFDEFLEYVPELQVLSQQSSNDHFSLKLRYPADLDIKHDLARFIAENGWLIVSLYTEQKSLEEIFHGLTKGEIVLPDLTIGLETKPETPSPEDTLEISADIQEIENPEDPPPLPEDTLLETEKTKEKA